MRVVQVHSNTNRRTKMSNSLALRRRTFLNFGLLGSELLGVAYTQIRNPDSNLSLLGRS